MTRVCRAQPILATQAGCHGIVIQTLQTVAILWLEHAKVGVVFKGLRVTNDVAITLQ